MTDECYDQNDYKQITYVNNCIINKWFRKKKKITSGNDLMLN